MTVLAPRCGANLKRASHRPLAPVDQPLYYRGCFTELFSPPRSGLQCAKVTCTYKLISLAAAVTHHVRQQQFPLPPWISLFQVTLPLLLSPAPCASLQVIPHARKQWLGKTNDQLSPPLQVAFRLHRSLCRRWLFLILLHPCSPPQWLCPTHDP